MLGRYNQHCSATAVLSHQCSYRVIGSTACGLRLVLVLSRAKVPVLFAATCCTSVQHILYSLKLTLSTTNQSHTNMHQKLWETNDSVAFPCHTRDSSSALHTEVFFLFFPLLEPCFLHFFFLAGSLCEAATAAADICHRIPLSTRVQVPSPAAGGGSCFDLAFKEWQGSWCGSCTHLHW